VTKALRLRSIVAPWRNITGGCRVAGRSEHFPFIIGHFSFAIGGEFKSRRIQMENGK
jgi:hypothetical protein